MQLSLFPLNLTGSTEDSYYWAEWKCWVLVTNLKSGSRCFSNTFFPVRSITSWVCRRSPFITVQITFTLKRMADMVLLGITDLKFHSLACHRRSGFQVACSENRGKYYVMSTSCVPERFGDRLKYLTFGHHDSSESFHWQNLTALMIARDAGNHDSMFPCITW